MTLGATAWGRRAVPCRISRYTAFPDCVSRKFEWMPTGLPVGVLLSFGNSQLGALLFSTVLFVARPISDFCDWQ